MKDTEADEKELNLDWEAACKGACRQLFDGVSRDSLSRLEGMLLPIRYGENDLVFQAGSYAAGIYIVAQGLLQYGRRAEARRHILKLVGPGEMIGITALFMQGQPTRLGYAKALTDTTVAFVEREIMLELFHQEPSLAFNLCQSLTKEVLFLEYKLTRSVCRTIEENVALLLLSLGRKYGIKEERGLYVGVELQRSTMADILGISLESLMRVLRKLREQGIISSKGRKILINDEDRLVQSVEQPLPLPIELL